MDELHAVICQRFTDSEFSNGIEGQNFARAAFSRIAAKDKLFRRIDFKYCIFEDCYFRNCSFEDCDFTGAQFRNCVLRGSLFQGSHFDYCRFSGSIVPRCILDENMPGYENVKLELARSLRTNYSQVGDTEGVNRAISAELEATRVHLRKAAWSNESYYRKKYRGLARIKAIASDLWFRFLHLVWGNGESVWRVLTSVLVVHVALLCIAMGTTGSPLGSAAVDAFGLFWGTYGGTSYSPLVVACASAVRYVLLGLSVAVLVRRFSRR